MIDEWLLSTLLCVETTHSCALNNVHLMPQREVLECDFG